MTTSEVFQSIAKTKPKVIYISGKTSTGKSTFARRLQAELLYDVIELEAVLLEVIKAHAFDEQTTFHKVLRKADESHEKELFFAATDKAITAGLQRQTHMVIEGAVSNVETLARVLSVAPELTFIYFHPASLGVYIRNLTSRFMESGKDSYNGLPLKFWQQINPDEFETFCQTRRLSAGLEDSIAVYAASSQRESEQRLRDFQQRFNNIVVAEIQ